MSINQILLDFYNDVPVSRLDNTLEIGSSTETNDIGIRKVHIRFNNHFHIEVSQSKNQEVIVVITSGGISKEIDLQTFQQLIAMNY